MPRVQTVLSLGPDSTVPYDIERMPHSFRCIVEPDILLVAQCTICCHISERLTMYMRHYGTSSTATCWLGLQCDRVTVMREDAVRCYLLVNDCA